MFVESEEFVFRVKPHSLCIVFFSLLVTGLVRGEQWKEVSNIPGLTVCWELANAEGPASRPGVHRVNINEGSWLLEPVGNRTRATYTVYTDGGGIPPFIANIANKQGIWQLFEALRERVRDPK